MNSNPPAPTQPSKPKIHSAGLGGGALISARRALE